MADGNNQQGGYTAEEIELEVEAALERIAGAMSATKMYGTKKSPGVFTGDKELQHKASEFLLKEGLIQEAGQTGVKRSRLQDIS